ncbi:LysM peptidoglycan-binding domain-containing protein [Thiorhodococcus mannitoliphagus]|uniref:LysM peptidoglycan-binding domain-containing protein n=1 Tax=Thiorhodococcus mannitoliphagus TaxID=329406 RepID=A0A6P1DR31_9GAMM|nr:LysM peptidoglycan-binding domain-containing protein [Thiorhodococcus mannitoliphagus]NEX19613.1 LysM peptidoglycan-binding domain-containing protein [Thiorhodococcus mannitoliphagus]
MRHTRLARTQGRVALVVVPWLAAFWLPLAALSEDSPREREEAVDAEPAPPPQTPDQLHEKIEMLQSRVQGMEGKLRDSALARKTADQARMEAERRLAEGSQALEQMRDELTATHDRQAELEQALSDQRGLVERLAAELEHERKQNAALTARVETLAAQLPHTDGGNLTEEAAKEASAEAFLALKRQIDRPGADAEPTGVKSRAEAEDLLRKRQLKLARVTDALSVYRVRERDNLGLISNRFYGNSNQWRRLFQANRHLLDNPDQLTPGMTIVIP